MLSLAPSGSVFALENPNPLPNQSNLPKIQGTQAKNRLIPVYQGICDVKPDDPSCKTQ